MPTEAAELIFKFLWSFLFSVVVFAQIIFKGKILRRESWVATLLVLAPPGVVFGWFSARVMIGSFSGGFWSQLAGLALMLAGIAGYIWAIACLRHNWMVSAGVKEGHALVQKGPYRWVRHPMYLSMTIVALGSGLLVSNFMILIYTPVVLWLYYLRARIEEGLLREDLPGYDEYSKRTRMLIPALL